MPVISFSRSAARPAGSRICVAHLVRRKNGIEPFLRFIQAYTSHPPGIPCDLMIIYKGFPKDGFPRSIAGPWETSPTSPILSRTRDLTSSRISRRRNIFRTTISVPNSYSVILHGDWLRNLHTHIQGNNVGVAGATGSWQSIYSGSIEWKQRGFPLWKRILGAPWKLFLKMYFDPFPELSSSNDCVHDLEGADGENPAREHTHEDGCMEIRKRKKQHDDTGPRNGNEGGDRGKGREGIRKGGVE